MRGRMRDHLFFKDTPRKTLDMKGESIDFPVLYYDFRFILPIFTAKTKLLKNLLPHRNFRPIQLRPGTGLLGIAAFEYHDTSIGPYNEIAFAIPISFPPRITFPWFSVISIFRKNIFPVYIWKLPVTTELAYKGGVHFYNYPKFLSEITFQDQNEHVEVILKKGGNLILRLLAKKPLPTSSTGFEFHTYSIITKMRIKEKKSGTPQLRLILGRYPWQTSFGSTYPEKHLPLSEVIYHAWHIKI